MSQFSINKSNWFTEALVSVLQRYWCCWVIHLYPTAIHFSSCIFYQLLRTLQDNQRDLESATEKLSEYLERDITSENLIDIKQKVQDKYRYVRRLKCYVVTCVKADMLWTCPGMIYCICCWIFACLVLSQAHARALLRIIGVVNDGRVMFSVYIFFIHLGKVTLVWVRIFVLSNIAFILLSRTVVMTE